ncbi:glycerophosphodiester phosphodiesterase family protein [Nocardioides sp. W7]|uniref:glycerophosphodiester phosphodiesterase family protein n=1 Tax=Nocardioides sp. W7 TaxID=2931390 RepID=UPI001FD3617F|nr:glycerophosphodiester phosphodiesterase family protein [Nocardioides sp. W7]
MSRLHHLVPALAAAAVLSALPTLASNAVGAPAPSAPTAKQDQPRNPVVAHRGASRVAPEETLAAYRAAIAEGAAVLEGDVQLTRDGVPVLVHDDTLDTTTDAEQVFPDRAPWRVGDLTLAELKQLDAGSWVNEKYAGERVPTLAEVLRLGRGRVGFNLELKSPQNSPGVATRLAEVLRAHGYTDDRVDRRTGMLRIAVHSRDEAALHEFAGELPYVRISWLSGGAMLDDARLAELAPWTDAVYASPTRTSAVDVDRAHAVGLEVYSDPVDSPAQIGMALNQGYDYLVTNVPTVARRVLAGRSPGIGAGRVVIDHVLENPSGVDEQAENGEYVALRNTTARPLDVSGYRLTDYAGNVWLTTGDDAVIGAGGLFKVYVNSGTDRPDAHYNGHPKGIFDNAGGDTVYLLDEDQRLLDVASYLRP